MRLWRPRLSILADELEILGSHGMQAQRYDAMCSMIASGALTPEALIGRTISLEQSINALMRMDDFGARGVTVVTEF